jgi:hypothetical protein
LRLKGLNQEAFRLWVTGRMDWCWRARRARVEVAEGVDGENVEVAVFCQSA